MYMVGGGAGRIQRGRPYRAHRRWMQPQPQKPLTVGGPRSWALVQEVAMAVLFFVFAGVDVLLLLLIL